MEQAFIRKPPDSLIFLVKLFFPSLGVLAGFSVCCTYMAGYLCSDFCSDSWGDQQQSGECQAQSALAPEITERKMPRSALKNTQRIIRCDY